MDTIPQLERWQELLTEMRADGDRMAHNQKVDRQRIKIVPEIRTLLNRYCAGEVELEALRAEFDSRTRTDWEGFGFKGMSGAMFLNKLVKYLSGDDLGAALKAVIPVPDNATNAKERMQAFAGFLEGKINAGIATRAQLQPARLAFLIGGWWHIQDKERWPVFYQSARTTLQTENLFEGGNEPVDDYFTFRQVFFALAESLKIDVWTCEHLLDWMNQRKGSTPPPPPDPPPGSGDDGETIPPEETGTHVHVQWLLTKIGRKLGCQVWVAANDRGKECNGEKLGDLCIDALPDLGLGAYSQKVITLIDVVWIKGAKQVAAAFEVEHTTSIFSGLLRMSDLILQSPNLNFPLYIVAPQARLQKVACELCRPTFQYLELHKRCGYFSDEDLIARADEIMRWATDPSAIQKLATHVPDTPTE